MRQLQFSSWSWPDSSSSRKLLSWSCRAPTQVNDSSHQIRQDSAGKMRESHRILQESTRNQWNMEAVFRLEIFRIFSGRNTASTKSPELPGTGVFRAGLFDLGRNDRISEFRDI
jgi:hypothetical protein